MRSLTLAEEHQPSLTSDRFASIPRGVVFCPAGQTAQADGAAAWLATAAMIYRIAHARATAEVASSHSIYNAPPCLN